MAESKQEFFDNEPLFKKWLALFNHHDPCGLIAWGAPEDEYSQELFVVHARISECHTKEQAQSLVWQTFTKFNGSTFPIKSDCEKLGTELWKLTYE